MHFHGKVDPVNVTFGFLTRSWLMQVDFLPSKALTPEALEKQRLALEARSRALRNVVTIIDGNQANFEIMIDATFK